MTDVLMGLVLVACLLTNIFVFYKTEQMNREHEERMLQIIDRLEENTRLLEQATAELDAAVAEIIAKHEAIENSPEYKERVENRRIYEAHWNHEF